MEKKNSFSYISIQIEFSDESDTEANPPAEPEEKTDVPKKRTTTRRAAQNCKTAPDPPAEKVPAKRPARGKKTTAMPRVSSEDEESLVCQAASTRRGRSRRELSKAEADSVEEPDKMRTIEEEANQVLNISIEQLRTSDSEEAEDRSASSKDIGV